MPDKKKKTRYQRKNTKPYKYQKRTYLQGTILRLFEYHCETSGLKDAEYIRHLVIKDLSDRYEINATGGVVKINRQ